MMLCPSCQNFRPANNDLCPWCNAPAASAGNAWGGQQASFAASQNQQHFANSWGGPPPSGSDWDASAGQFSFPTASWPDPASSGVQQLSFAQSGVQPAGNDHTFWSQTESSPDGKDGPPSLLPVPYQDPSAPNAQALMVMPAGFPTLSPNVQAVNSMLPALPDQEAPVYVPPMYTKPRPIIPRYRAVSGLLSVIIVLTLLCGGAGYFAQVTGKLAPLERFFGVYNPPAVGVASHNLPVPSMQQTPGPGNKVITSVGLGKSVDPNSHLVPVYENTFAVGEQVWIACDINNNEAGTVTVKWYTNGNFDSQQPKAVAAKQTVIVDFFISFGTPAEGRADIYWNNDLAETVLFVIEPEAQ